MFNIARRRLGASFHVEVRVTISIVITRLGGFLDGQFRLDSGRVRYFWTIGRLRMVVDRVDVGEIAIALVAVGYVVAPIGRQGRSMPIDRTNFRWGRHGDIGGGACLLQDDDVSEELRLLQASRRKRGGWRHNRRLKAIEKHRVSGEQHVLMMLVASRMDRR
jgi:hypothetical protein